MKNAFNVLAVLLCVSALALTGTQMVNAQAGPPPGGPGGPGGGNFNPEQMQEMMLQRIQQELGTTDAEWETLAPLVENVLQLQHATRMVGPGGPRGGRGPRGPEALSTEVDALRTVLDSDTTTDAQITAALKDLRSTRAAEEQKLLKAREDLRAMVTLRQEAKLVLLGLLD